MKSKIFQMPSIRTVNCQKDSKIKQKNIVDIQKFNCLITILIVFTSCAVDEIQLKKNEISIALSTIENNEQTADTSLLSTDSSTISMINTGSDSTADTDSSEQVSITSIPCQIPRCNSSDECNNTSKILHLRGSDAMVEIPHHSVLDMTSPYTIEFWFCLNSYNGYESLFHKYTASLEDKQFLIDSSSNTIQSTFWVGPSESIELFLGGVDPIPLSTWTHIAVVYVGTKIELYIDGAFKSSSSNFNPIQNSSGPLYLGASIIDSVLFEGADASIAEVRISSNARYVSSFIPQVNISADSNTIALWKLNEGTGTTINDLRSSTLNGTLSGGYVWGN